MFRLNYLNFWITFSKIKVLDNLIYWCFIKTKKYKKQKLKLLINNKGRIIISHKQKKGKLDSYLMFIWHLSDSVNNNLCVIKLILKINNTI